MTTDERFQLFIDLKQRAGELAEAIAINYHCSRYEDELHDVRARIDELRQEEDIRALLAKIESIGDL